MINQNVAATLLFLLAAGASAQTMPKKWDQNCLDSNSRAYISCMANARSEQAKNDCQKTKSDDDKKCKLSMAPPEVGAVGRHHLA